MTLHVRTARIGAKGLTDALDITRKSATGDGLAFAPSWSILRPALDARKTAQRLREVAAGSEVAGWAQDEAAMADAEAWAIYKLAFVVEMRQSYRAQRDAWDRLLALPSATLLCYCTDPKRCHRTLLGASILPKLGAVYEGEVRT